MTLPTAACVVLTLAVSGTAPPPKAVRAAVEKALPLLTKAAVGHIDQRTCFGCHNQAFPMAAFAAARARGFKLDDDLVPGQVEHVREFVSQNEKAYRSGRGTGGQADTAGWILFTLDRAGHTADDRTDAVVEYLLQKDADRGHWRTSSDRPPSEASHFTANYLAVRGLKAWGNPEQKDAIAARIGKARDWALKTPAKDTEDRVFRLRLLHESGAKPEAIRDAAKELAAGQRLDGGWGQLDALRSDAYATGSALVALNEAGGLATDAPAYRRGLGFLVRAQLADGSWFVKSRSRPFQLYYESGFPHKKDQFISSSASGWAAAALALACPKE